MVTKEQLWQVMADGKTSRNTQYPSRKAASSDAVLYKWKTVKAHIAGHPRRVLYLSFSGSDFQNNRPADLGVYGPDYVSVVARIDLKTGIDQYPSPVDLRSVRI